MARIGVAVVRREAAAEGAFQGADSHGVVVVVFWELQDGVEVFGQDGDGDGFVGVAASGFLPCCAKCGDVAGEPVAAAVLQDGGDEVGAAFGVVATVVWHGVSVGDGGFVVGQAPPYVVVTIGSRVAGFSWWGKPHPTRLSR